MAFYVESCDMLHERKYRITFVTAFGPGSESGGAKATSEIMALLRSVEDVELESFIFCNQITKSGTRMQVIETSILRRFFGFVIAPFFYPVFTGRISMRVLKQLCRDKNKSSLIILNFSQVFLYSFFLWKRNMVLVCHDVIYQNYRRRSGWLYGLLARWVYLSEYMILHMCRGRVFCLSKKDVRILRAVYGIEANVVDWGLDNLLDRVNRLSREVNGARIKDLKYFCFFGAWSRPENAEGLIWFIDSVLPKLNPEIKICVIGSGMPSKLTKKIAGSPQIFDLGFLENPYPVLRDSIALLAPLFVGAGVKIKCLEAISCGVPVVGTNVALEGLRGLVDGQFVLCQTESEFVTATNAMFALGVTGIQKKNPRLGHFISLSKNRQEVVSWSKILESI